MKPMTVAEAIAFLSTLPGNTKIVLPGSDHSYDPARMEFAQAEIQYQGSRVYMWEYYDQGNMTNETNAVEGIVVVSEG